MVAGVVRRIGKMREVGFQPWMVIMSGLESRDSGLFVLFIACSVVTTITDHGNYVFVCLPEGLSAGLTLHIAFLVSLFCFVVIPPHAPKPH